MKKPQKPKNKLLFWLPRIITIIFILFISMFSLDVFGTGQGFWTTLLALFMHLLPTIILVLILILFWKKSILLGSMWVAFGIVYIAVMIPNMIKHFEYYYLSWLVMFSGVAFVIAFLFFLDKFKQK